MAISTYKTFLMTAESAAGPYTKLIDIKDFPDLGGEPEMLDTTTLSDGMTTSILGIQSLDALTFTANYTLADYKKLLALKDTEKQYAVWMGGTGEGASLTPTGAEGKYAFTGRLNVYVTGGGVNEVVGMTITIAASTPITLDEGEE